MAIDVLHEDEWDDLEPILKEKFDGATIPNKGKAMIVADRDESGKVVGFIVLEMLLRVGQVWSEGKARIPAMLDYVENSIGPETSVIVIASEERFDSLCERFKMHKMPGTVYRRDF